jgi:two-component system cell cycle sensor histidine kinase/response regulator CckA
MKDEAKTKEQLIAELTILRERIAQSEAAQQERNQTDQNMAFLSQTAMELVELSSQENIYQFIGEKLKQLAGKAVVIINSFDKESDSLCTRALIGVGPFTPRLLALIGRDPLGMTYPITNEEGRRRLLSGKLVQGPKGLHELSFGSIPESTCRAIEELLGFGRIYGIGFAWKGDLFGSAIIITGKRHGAGSGLRDRELIETFMHMAAVALQRRDTEEALQRAHDELEVRVKERTAELVQANRHLKEEIEERKHAEQALHQSEHRYRSLVEAATDVIFSVSTDGIITSLNPASGTITGWTHDECIGKPFTSFIHPEDIPFAMELFQHILQGERVPIYELRILSKQGGFLTGQFSSTPLVKDGIVIGILGIARDITEQRKAEQEKVKLQVQLQQAQKMETLGILAGEVAHDLNNILSGVVTYPDFLLMQLPEESNLRKPITTIQNSGNKAAAIVEDLLTLARRGVPTMEILDLNEIITEYLKSPEYDKLRLFHPDVVVKVDLKGDILNISGSRVHLTKALMNLVSNGAEAIEEGGTITISTENRSLDKPIHGYDKVTEGDYVILSVSDTGMGISEEEIEKIFEPFYTKKKMGRSGTGLGMAVVRGTVRDHGGYIDVQSTEGEGTTFTLYFPATREVRANTKLSVSPEEYRGKGESILVVDDVKEQLDIAATILSELGYSVSIVLSGEEAIAYLKEHRADLIILDMIMEPGIDGLDTYREIIKLHPDQKAIIASGFSETDRVKEAQRLGAGKYIQKPYTMEKIGMAVREELGGIR